MFVSCIFFFFKQKTAYEMRISDWSSDVCSSDLQRQQQEGQEGEALVHGRISSCGGNEREGGLRLGARGALHRDQLFGDLQRLLVAGGLDEIGRASCRERVCQTCRSRWAPDH